MTMLQARLFAGRSVRAAQAQEQDARLLRAPHGSGSDIPTQRPPAEDPQAVADEVR